MIIINHTLKLNISVRPTAYLSIRISLKGLWDIREREIESSNNNGIRKILMGILAGTIVAGAISIVSLIV